MLQGTSKAALEQSLNPGLEHRVRMATWSERLPFPGYFGNKLSKCCLTNCVSGRNMHRKGIVGISAFSLAMMEGRIIPLDNNSLENFVSSH